MWLKYIDSKTFEALFLSYNKTVYSIKPNHILQLFLDI